jgi:predicted phosphodiesterase
MEMIAILSDIHGNIHALEAVLADMPPVSEVWVLGDTAGGGAFPNESLDRLMGLDVPVTSVMGNWEGQLLEGKRGLHPQWWEGGRFGFSSSAWTVDNLKPRHWEYIESLKVMEIKNGVPGGALLYHSEPDDIYAGVDGRDDAVRVASGYKQKWFFGGHVHKMQMHPVGDRKVVTVGSVGLSADGIGGVASYALFDGEALVFRHVAYDVEAAVKAFLDSDYGKSMEPYIIRAAAATMITGVNYLARFFAFIRENKKMPDDLWVEAALSWKVEDWLEDLLRRQ